jgi:hypothetical protein
MASKYGPGFPLVICAIIAAVSLTQDNVGGAIFAGTAGVVISLVLWLRARRDRVR